MSEAMIQGLVEKYVNIWLQGIQDEVDFWYSWLLTGGGGGESGRISGQLAVASHNDEFIDYADKNFRVLDAGSGPISNFGIEGTGGKIHLTACDALADIYADMMKKFGIKPYCTTDFGCFEGLAQVYGHNQFDYVHVSNSLDHCFDPLLGVHNLISVVKKGKYIRLRHARNEAENERYEGLHQWNLTVENSEFIIWNKNISYNISRLFNCCCDFSFRTAENPEHIVVVIHKNTDYIPFEILHNSFYLINKCLIKKVFEHAHKASETNSFLKLRSQLRKKGISPHAGMPMKSPAVPR